jgi:hypothetical protein
MKQRVLRDGPGGAAACVVFSAQTINDAAGQ